jgi:hypothetical protein
MLAAHACEKHKTARKSLWQLERNVRRVEKEVGRELDISELMIAFNEWHRLAESSLDPAKTRDDYLIEFLDALRKVRVATGEGETIKKAIEAVSKLSPAALPTIPGMPEAPERCRRVLALHRELHRLCNGNAYFLSSRDTAKVLPGLRHQQASEINDALQRLGAIEHVRRGDQRPNGKAAYYRYLLPEIQSYRDEDDEGFD